MKKASLCRECGKYYIPVVWYNWMDYCKVCSDNMEKYFERQMNLLQFNKPKLLYPKRDK